jgi:Holliday junction DNA helicase RuvB
LSELKVDELGLEQLDREYLSMITQKFGGGPVGLDTLSTAIGEDRFFAKKIQKIVFLQQKAKIMATSVCLLMQSHG